MNQESPVESEGIVCDSRAQWLAERRKRVQASDVAPIIGMGYSGSNQLTVWQEKVIGAEEEDERELLRIGLEIEPAIRRIVAWRTGCEVVDPLPFYIVVSKKYPWIGSSLDGLIAHEEWGLVPLECKNVSDHNARQWDNGATPLDYVIQNQVQMLSADSKHGCIAALIGGNRVEIRWQTRDDDFLAELVTRLGRFWEMVTRREVPEPDGTDASADVLKKLYPLDNGKAVWLPEHMTDVADAFLFARAARLRMEKWEKSLGNQIKAVIGKNTFGVLGGNVFSWRRQEYAQSVKPAGSSRVLRNLKRIPKNTEFVKWEPPKLESNEVQDE